MNQPLFKSKRFWLGLGITAVFLFFVFRKVDAHALAAAMANANYCWLLPALVVYLGGYWLRAVRWTYLMRSVKPLSWQRLLPPLIISFMVNNVMPARAGEIVGPYLVGRREQVSKSAVFATVVMQRVFDGLVMVLFAVVVLMFYRMPASSLHPDFVRVVDTVIKVTAVLFVLLFICLFAAITWKERFSGVMNAVMKILPASLREPAGKISHSFLDGLAVLRDRRDSFRAFLFSLLAWSGETAAYYCILRAFGLELPLYASVMLMAVVNLGIMIPSSPGYIGPFEFFGVGTLMLFGIEKSLSLPPVLIIHSFVWLPITIWGFYYMWTMKLKLKEMEQ